MSPADAWACAEASIPVKRKQVERLADKLGAGAVPVVKQCSGAAAAPLAVRRRRRGRVGYGKRLRRAPQRGREDFGVPFAHECGGLRFTFSCRQAGAVAGVGLFTERAIRKRVLLGAFTGKVLTPSQATRAAQRSRKEPAEVRLARGKHRLGRRLGWPLQRLHLAQQLARQRPGPQR